MIGYINNTIPWWNWQRWPDTPPVFCFSCPPGWHRTGVFIDTKPVDPRRFSYQIRKDVQVGPWIGSVIGLTSAERDSLKLSELVLKHPLSLCLSFSWFFFSGTKLVVFLTIALNHFLGGKIQFPHVFWRGVWPHFPNYYVFLLCFFFSSSNVRVFVLDCKIILYFLPTRRKIKIRHKLTDSGLQR